MKLYTTETILDGEAATVEFAKKFSKKLQPPLRIYFSGEIGAGKSCFIRATLQQLGVNQKIKSPTFSMIESYLVDEHNYVHIDLYRIQDEEEFMYLAIDEYDTDKSIFFIEWPEKVPNLPSPDILITLKSLALGQKRKIIIQSKDEHLFQNE